MQTCRDGEVNSFQRTAFPWTIAAILSFSALWAAPRFWLFQGPAMMHDDYLMAAIENVYQSFYVREYRILGGVYPMLCKWIFSDFYASSTPIYLNALMIGSLCMMLYQLMIAMNCSRVVSAATTMFFCWHPVIDDLSAWNTPGFGLLAAVMITGAFFFAWSATKLGIAVATVLIFCSLASYQLMLPLPVCLTVLLFAHRAAVDHQWEWKRAFSVAMAMILALTVYFGYMLILSPLIFGPFEGSGFRTFSELMIESRGLAMQSLNLYLNLFYSLFSFHAGIKPGLSLWYYVPLLIAAVALLTVSVGVYRQRIRLVLAPLLVGCWLGLPFLAILPLWFIPLYTEWRISFIVIIPQVIAIGSLLATVKYVAAADPIGTSCNSVSRVDRILAYSIAGGCLAAAGTMIPVTVADCRMRQEDYRHDVQIVESIRNFRQSLGEKADTHRVMYVLGKQQTLAMHGDERTLMKANYVINTYSTFSYGKIWAYAMFRWYQLESVREEELDMMALSSEPHEVDVNTKRFADLPYVQHYPERGLSVVVGVPQWFTWTVSN
jgi:hypothetical protein